jgi:LL-diaminopimelate aminotransferase
LIPQSQAIADFCYKDMGIKPEEIFCSDGAKCDIARLQMMFGPGVTSAVQDPSYPVYVDTSVMIGQTGLVDKGTAQFDGIVYMPCAPAARDSTRVEGRPSPEPGTKEENFFPKLEDIPRADVYYFCCRGRRG